MLKCFVGWDRRSRDAYLVSVSTLRGLASLPVDVQILHETHLRATGLYSRPTEDRNGQLWDVISDAPMSTEFALTRFLVPILSRHSGWALFCDDDFLFRADVAELFAEADPRYALMCVKHPERDEHGVKMDGQKQVPYRRKWWSSLVLWNCSHPAHKVLTLQDINRKPGRELHRFCWLDDALIGALDPTWNWLPGISDPIPDPKAVHFTLGTPDLAGYEDQRFAAEWRQALSPFAARTAA